MKEKQRNSSEKTESSTKSTTNRIENKQQTEPKCCQNNNTSILLVLAVCVGLTAINIYEIRRLDTNRQVIVQEPAPKITQPTCPSNDIDNNRPTYWVYGRNVDSGYLKHVFLVLERLGYQRGTNNSNWDLLWAHDYPFRALYSQLNNLKPHQKVNHFPGCGYITNKVDLSTSGVKNMPLAFKLPQDKEKLLDYVNKNPDKLFVQKSNAHRGIKIEPIKTLNLNSNETFIQEYVDKPFLVDGYKFDIGVYTIITSIKPLRIYIYYGDVLFRYCPVKYYPFDPENLDKYVVGDDYLPTWEVPSLTKLYDEYGYSMKDSFDAYVRMQGKNPKIIWEQINDSIMEICLKKEKQISNILERFKSKSFNFFEMVRFDFVIDEDLNVYVMEANMSPNLSSAHYPPNQLLYEQVIFNLMGLVGLANRVKKPSLATRNRPEEMMQTADKNLVVYPEECVSKKCDEDCLSPNCDLCLPCLTSNQRNILVNAYREYVNRGDCKRIFPPSMNSTETNLSLKLATLSEENQWLYRWFYGKCLLDDAWC